MRSYKETAFALARHLIDAHKQNRTNMSWVIFEMICIATMIIANWRLIGMVERSLPWSLMMVIGLTVLLCLIVVIGETHKIKLIKKGLDGDESKKKS
jgi:hypothetical protein